MATVVDLFQTKVKLLFIADIMVRYSTEDVDLAGIIVFMPQRSRVLLGSFG